MNFNEELLKVLVYPEKLPKLKPTQIGYGPPPTRITRMRWILLSRFDTTHLN